MKRRGYPKKQRAGLVLAGVGAAMIISLLLPFWFWWLAIGIGLLWGGLRMLRR
ncbi:MAG: hypothetical protein FWE28_02355 [Oscillospiraceae bacterium]|nr:hypothetical protein [Oscillospiraceae bacterium]